MNVLYGCNNSSAQTGRCRHTTNSKYTIPKICMAVNHPKSELWHKRHFGATAVGIYTALFLTSLYECHSLCTQTGQCCGTSSSWGIIPIIHVAVHHSKERTLMQTVFGTTAVRICAACWLKFPYACLHSRTETGRSRVALYIVPNSQTTYF